MDDDEILYRQIHPTWIVNGVPTSQGFRPTPKDDGHMSVDRSTLTDPASSYDLHGNVKSLETAGTWGVSVQEFAQEQVACRPDPVAATPTEVGNAAHAVADFNPLAPKRWKPISQKLKSAAQKRGRLYPPLP